MLDNLRMCGPVESKLGIRIIPYTIYTWQKLLFNLLTNIFKIIAKRFKMKKNDFEKNIR